MTAVCFPHILRTNDRTDRESSDNMIPPVSDMKCLHAQFSRRPSVRDLSKSSAARLSCTWSWMTTSFYLMDPGKLIVVQLRIHNRKLLIRTNNGLRRSVKLGKQKKQIPGAKQSVPLLPYTVNKWSSITVGKCNYHMRSIFARANQPPETIYFQVRKNDAAVEACVEKLFSLSYAAYEW